MASIAHHYNKGRCTKCGRLTPESNEIVLGCPFASELVKVETSKATTAFYGVIFQLLQVIVGLGMITLLIVGIYWGFERVGRDLQRIADNCLKKGLWKTLFPGDDNKTGWL